MVVYHFRGLHQLGELNVDKPFYASVAGGASTPFYLIKPRRHFRNCRSFSYCLNPPINSLDWFSRRGEIIQEPNID